MTKKRCAIIYGSETGATDHITSLLVSALDLPEAELLEVAKLTAADFLKYEIIFMGVSTWYIGDLQSDWEDFFPQFQTIDFSGIKVAIYGLGDQYGYPDNFIDGVGMLAVEVLKNGGEIYGYWPTDGYDFDESLGLAPNKMFYGLAIDEDNQEDLSHQRLLKWIELVKGELDL